jgi:neutral ceramidase
VVAASREVLLGKDGPAEIADGPLQPSVTADRSSSSFRKDTVSDLCELTRPRQFFRLPTYEGDSMTLSFRRLRQSISVFAPGFVLLFVSQAASLIAFGSDVSLRVGVAEADITPPVGFPMAGYYHERLAEGEIDPLKARAIVFVDGATSGALVVCDLIGISTDLKNEVRKRASEKTGIPAEHIALSATHSHTAPDYMKELYLRIGNEPQPEMRANYIDKLIDGPVDAICTAFANAKPSFIETGSGTQNEAVAFNRRAVTRDGSVKTWMAANHPDFVRTAGPIDPQIGLVMIRDEAKKPVGVLSNFALHLDTVGGMKWSADYPFFIERTLQQSLGAGVISIFGNGCCGDINHVNPRSTERNTAAVIGQSIGNSIVRDLPGLQPIGNQKLTVKSRVVQLPLQDATQEEVEQSIEVLNKAKRKEPVEFLEHVTAYKKLIIDQMRHKEPFAKTGEHITWGLSRSLAGIGDTLPVDMTVITLGTDVAIVALPGEAFVELGLSIKQASPFRTTLVIELSNCVETIYVPTRAAAAGGSYEVTNSTTLPGSGELIVETAISLLREAAAEVIAQTPATP